MLAGGRGSRLGGVDKGAIRAGEGTLLDRALGALDAADEVLVVGDRADDAGSVRHVREQPAFAGPGAALLTGVFALAKLHDAVAILAVDMPFVERSTIGRLLDAAHDHDGAVLVGDDGRRQLAMVLRTERLIDTAPDRADWEGMPVRRVLEPLTLADVPSQGSEARDVDTPEDLESVRHTDDR